MRDETRAQNEAETHAHCRAQCELAPNQGLPTPLGGGICAHLRTGGRGNGPKKIAVMTTEGMGVSQPHFSTWAHTYTHTHTHTHTGAALINTHTQEVLTHIHTHRRHTQKALTHTHTQGAFTYTHTQEALTHTHTQEALKCRRRGRADGRDTVIASVTSGAQARAPPPTCPKKLALCAQLNAHINETCAFPAIYFGGVLRCHGLWCSSVRREGSRSALIPF